MQDDRKTHYEGLKKENDELISRINNIRAAQAQQEPKIAKVGPGGPGVKPMLLVTMRESWPFDVWCGIQNFATHAVNTAPQCRTFLA